VGSSFISNHFYVSTVFGFQFVTGLFPPSPILASIPVGVTHDIATEGPSSTLTIVNFMEIEHQCSSDIFVFSFLIANDAVIIHWATLWARGAVGGKERIRIAIAIELWGCAKPSNTKILQSFQSKTLRSITGAP
jgi:hypothetical protein